MIGLKDVTKEYPDGTTAVHSLNLEAPTGKLTVLVGPSGCGKTTTLRMINRLIRPTSGTIELDGVDTATLGDVQLRRKIGYVIQNAGLFPHRTALDNVAALPILLGEKKAPARANAMELLERVGLTADHARRYPWQLSGGQQQRVGVARALATDPPYLLMDEPFSAVDPIVRNQLQDEFLRLQREIGKTIVMVTHDIDEALKLGDQVAVLQEGGFLAQLDTPQRLLERPASPFVADFLGNGRGFRSLQFAIGDAVARLADESRVGLGATPRTDGWHVVVDDRERPLGWTRAASPVREQDVDVSGTVARADGSLRELLDAALSSPTGRGLVVDTSGVFLGTVSIEDASQLAAEAHRGRAA
ncbi:ABC transporter ATP-binding protein [Leifsonia shinshuensis]|uniref:ABC-type quaternary amine transporter n=1 Tax=Leifsonia shinshuensis TaxID=150026 RepID=A0A853D2V1_9MICO|nr:ATP-binding cassette domain-containing protein [Leifsonia shinshuensis]NYJ25761.1 osmoprotectant transport system ATP-binding protein [Leifsonia shinshuensis]